MITLYTNDYGFNIPFTCQNYDGTAKNLTGYIPTLRVRNAASNTLLFSGSTTIDTATSGTCHYIVVSTNLSAIGLFNADLQLWNSTSSILQTWGDFQITIKEAL